MGGDARVLALDEMGIEASRGAACTAGDADPSSVLMAMGLTGEKSRSSLRFSLGKQNTQQDIDRAIAAIPQAIGKLRKSSSFYLTRQELLKK